jgi:hypothetical protein
MLIEAVAVTAIAAFVGAGTSLALPCVAAMKSAPR